MELQNANAESHYRMHWAESWQISIFSALLIVENYEIPALWNPPIAQPLIIITIDHCLLSIVIQMSPTVTAFFS